MEGDMGILHTKDGCHTYEVPMVGLRLSRLFASTMIVDPTNRSFHLPELPIPIAEKIVSFMRYHSTAPTARIPTPLPTNSLVNIVDDFDLQFVDCDLHTLTTLILVANYLNIEALSNLALAKLATLMMGKTKEELRETLGVRADLSPEEYNRVKAHYKDILDWE